MFGHISPENIRFASRDRWSNFQGNILLGQMGIWVWLQCSLVLETCRGFGWLFLFYIDSVLVILSILFLSFITAVCISDQMVELCHYWCCLSTPGRGERSDSTCNSFLSSKYMSLLQLIFTSCPERRVFKKCWFFLLCKVTLKLRRFPGASVKNCWV